jgi:hypothetical protein
VARTHDVADIKAALDFLREIREIRLPGIEQPKAERLETRRRLREVQFHLERAARGLDLAISSWREQFKAQGLGEEFVISKRQRRSGLGYLRIQ